MIVAVCVAGSTNDISRTNASSDPPKNCHSMSAEDGTNDGDRLTYLDDPYRRLLFAPKYTLCADNARL